MATKQKTRSAVSVKKPVGKLAEADINGLIRKKAHALWEQKGRVQGKDVDIWLEAERAVCKGVN